MFTDTTRLQKGDKFKIDLDYHGGRTYEVIGFAPNKWGIVHAICDYGGRGDCAMFTAEDLNTLGRRFRMWNTSRRPADNFDAVTSRRAA